MSTGVNFRFDWEAGSFEMDGGSPVEISGRDAAQAWADQMLHIRRGRLEIMPSSYGTSAQDLIGKRLPAGYRMSELEREIAENVKLCDGITSVDHIAYDGKRITMDMVLADAPDETIAFSTDSTPISSPIIITRQPEDQTKSVGDVSEFIVEATGEDLTYHWQRKAPTDDGYSFFSATHARDARMASYVTADRNGYQYRCIITNGNGFSVASESATLTVV